MRNESSRLRGGLVFWMVEVMAPDSCTVVRSFIHLWLLLVLRNRGGESGAVIGWRQRVRGNGG